MVHHLCPPSVVLLWVAQAACLVGRPSNARCNQLHVHMHTWPPIGTMEGTKQLVPLGMPKGVMCICQQLSIGHEWWYIHPMLGQGGHGWEKDLQFFAVCLIHLPQLPKSVGLIHILGQPAHPEVVNQRPILGYISCSPHGYCTLTGLTKPWPIMQLYAARLEQHSPCGSNGCTSCKVSWRGNHGPAHTTYMAGHPMVVWPIQAGQLHTH